MDDVKAFLKGFERLDYAEPKHRSRLLEIFVNKVYLYDDYAIIIYNGTEESNKINLENKKPNSNEMFEFGSFGSTNKLQSEHIGFIGQLFYTIILL